MSIFSLLLTPLKDKEGIFFTFLKINKKERIGLESLAKAGKRHFILFISANRLLFVFEKAVRRLRP